MGATLHFFDFNQTGKSGKLLMHTRHFEGLEAPRNSLELPLESSQSLFSKDESIPYSYQVKHQSTKIEFCQSGTPMKLLIDREISKEPEVKQSVPSVVARLMGLDKLPTDSKPPTYERNCGLSSGKATVDKELMVPRELNHSKRDAHFSRKKQEPHDSGTSSKLSKSLVRDHPQEQELQNFKKEFEAWQASKVWESLRGCTLDLKNGFWYDQRTLAQERLNKEKLARYTGAKRNRTYEKPPEIGYDTPSRLETSVQPETDFQGNKSSLYQGNQLEAFSMWNGNRCSKCGRTHSMEYEEQQTRALPKKIVILKPGPERFEDSDESQSLSESAIEEEEEEEGSIEDFLKEVKERLILGMRGNSIEHIKQRNNEISSYCGRPNNPKEIAQQIAKQVRDSVTTRDMSLLRSESMRSQKSVVQVGTPGSSEFINRDTRKFLSGRLKNVLKGDTDTDMGKMAKESRTSMFHEGPLPIGPDFSKTGKNVDYLNGMQDMAGLKARSFRHDMKNENKFNRDDLSPRNLIRSMSAPVSGTAFGKLLLEDQPTLTGAHVRRKHEMADNVSTELRKKKKSRFNLKGTVSSLRYSLTLRGKFFGKRIQSVERGVDEFGLTKTALTLTIPSLARNLNVQENSTEVPPSPASACSDSQDGLFSGLTNHTSPVSTLDVPFSEDLSISDAFQEISSNLQELKQQIDQLGFNGTDVVSQDGREEDIIQPEGEEELEGPEVYLRDVLGVAGIFEGLDGIVSMWDSTSAPIRSWVFEDVEEDYWKKSKQRQGSVQDPSDSRSERKLLFDLLNEALESKLGLLASDVMLSKSFLGSRMMLPSSKQLIDVVCATVNMSAPSFMGNETIEGIVVKDVETTPWMRVMQGDIHLIGSDMEKIILNELVEEAVIEFCR